MGKICKLADKSVRKMLETHAGVLREHVDVVKAEDPDGIHDMRVASRRLRAVLTGNGAMLKGKALKRFRKLVREITSLLGQPRELDVTLELLERHRKDLSGPPRYALSHVVRHVQRERAACNGSTVHAAELVGSEKFEKRFSALLKGFKAQKCYVKTAVRYTSGRYRTLMKQYDIWKREGSEEALHGLRIAFKKSRYACETFGHLYGDGMKKMLEQFREAQETLGDWHDYCILRKYIEKSRADAPPKAAAGMDALLEAMDVEAKRSLERFAPCAEKFFAPKHRKAIRSFLKHPKTGCCGSL